MKINGYNKIPWIDYLIDIHGNIKNIYGADCRPTIETRGNDKYLHCKMTNYDNKVNAYSLDWLWLCAKHKIPKWVNPKHVSFHELPHFRTKDSMICVYSKPYYYEKDFHFRYVPGFDNIICSPYGELYYTDKRPVKIYNTNGYLQCTVNSRNYKVHRLIALTWVRGISSKQYMINHKDGNKLNNIVTNLEWCDHKQNNKHAALMGLNSRSVKCRLRNINTKEILEFPNIKEASVYLASIGKPNTLSHRKHKASCLISEMFEFRMSGDSRPWFYIDVDNKPTNYINPSTAAFHIYYIDKGNSIDVINGHVRMCNEYGLWNITSHSSAIISKFKEMYPELKISMKTFDYIKMIEILDRTSLKVSCVESIRAVNRLTGIDRSVIARLLKSNGSKILQYQNTRISMRYHSNDEWPSVTTDHVYGQTIIVHDKINNKTIEYPSLRSAAKDLNMTRQTIKRIIANPNYSNNFSITIKTLEM